MRAWKCAVFLAAIMGFVAFNGMALSTWDGDAGDGDWFTASNWDPDGVPAQGETVMINGSAAVMLTSSTAALKAFTIANTATLTFSNWNTALSADDVIIGSGAGARAGLFHAVCDTNSNPENVNRIYIVCSNLTLNTNGFIDANRSGFRGFTNSIGQGYGGSTATNGASYGGLGGGSFPGLIYPVGIMANFPVDPGSGAAVGYHLSNLGGDGGGYIRISALNQVILNGVISANGSNGTSVTALGGGGGGSGGGILIACGSLISAPGTVISATGGSCAVTTTAGCGGGGGRVAMWCRDQNAYAGSINVAGGFAHSTKTGSPGAIAYGWLPDFRASSTSVVVKAMRGNETTHSVTFWNQSSDNQSQNLYWSLVNTNEWVAPSASNGVMVLAGSDTLVLTNRSAGFELGTHYGQVHISATNVNRSYQFSPQPLEKTVHIRMEVMELSNSVSVLTNQVMAGFSPDEQTFEIWNAGSDSFAYRVAGDVGWLKVAPTGGVCSSTHIVLTNQYVTEGLYDGVYTGVVTITSLEGGGMARTVKVIMNVIAKSQLSVSPLQINATSSEEYDTSNQVFNVWNGNRLYTLAWDASSSTNWLTLSPTNGLSIGGTQAVTMSFATAALTTGVYAAHVIINGAVVEYGGVIAWNSPQTVDVNLVVSRPMPEVRLTWTNVNLIVNQGVQAPGQTLGVLNATGRYTLDFTVSNNAPWMVVNPDRGSNTGEVDAIRIGLDTADLALGAHTGVVTVTAVEQKYGVPAIGSPTEARVVVRVNAPGTGFTRVVRVSQGTWDNRIEVSWDVSAGEAWYEVWRGTTYDLGYADKITESGGTNITDTVPKPGAKTYYWIRPVSAVGGLGVFSTNSAGWRCISAPEVVLASDGVYSDKIRVEWAAVEAPDGVLYEVWRNVQSAAKGIAEDSGKNAAPGLVYVSSSRVFDDKTALVNNIYEYIVRAKVSSEILGQFSGSDTGYTLATVSDISASEGVFTDRVRVTWSPAAGASGYEIWRSTSESSVLATYLGFTGGLVFDDMSTDPGTAYYYWLKSKNVTAISAVAGGARGYRASGVADLKVENLSWLSGVQGAGKGPDVVSYRVTNHGVAMRGLNARVRHSIYYAPIAAPDSATRLVAFEEDMALASGASAHPMLSASRRAALAIPLNGTYVVWVEVRPAWPSTLGDTNLSDNVAYRSEPLVVRSGASLPYRAVNDYNGDGCSDLAVYDSVAGTWYIATMWGGAAYPLAWGATWGGAGYIPVRGDYDGDRVSDLAIYNHNNGKWYVLSGNGAVLAWGLTTVGFGMPAPGWYAGQAGAAAGVYESESGNWYVKTIGEQAVAWGVNWGGNGFVPVYGDFDGNGTWDLGVYDALNGRWYVRAVNGTLIAWGISWGGIGLEPVPGDYDGDGKWDLALYASGSGKWFIRGLDGTVLAWDVFWGGPGLTPVSGDYDGDGIWDLAFYQESTGTWFVRTLAGVELAHGAVWGGPGLVPVQ